MKYFITAIGTDSGKTIIAAALAQALQADYWKPIQAGYPTDSDTVKHLTNGQKKIHPEAYLLKNPMSPHAAAKLENICIDLKRIKAPTTQNPLIIEGAGGCLVPVNDDETVVELAKHCEAEILLVANNYLGSINHTLLTIDFLKRNNYPVKAIIFNGEPNIETENIILNKSGLTCFYKVPKLKSIDSQTITELGKVFKRRWDELGW